MHARERTRAHLFGYVCLLVLLSAGTASATHPGGADTISTEDVIDGQIRSADIGNSQVLSVDVRNESLTGADVDESTLAGLWRLGGNAATSPATDFLGTTDNQALNFRVNNLRALRLEPTATNQPNVIGGVGANVVAAGAHAATIAGGGNPFSANRVFDHWGTVGGGSGNRAGNGTGADPSVETSATVAGGGLNTASGRYSAVGGGSANTASGTYATVAGGVSNLASGARAAIGGGGADVGGGSDPNVASGDWATISGGQGGEASAAHASIGGGSGNTAGASHASVGGGLTNTAGGLRSTVGGGAVNTAGGTRSTVGGGESNEANADFSVIGGGNNNSASGSGDSTVAGGFSNAASASSATVGGGSVNTASGSASTVPGGEQNLAQGSRSFAAGDSAKALHDGSFVWADSSGFDIASTGADQFVVSANGGMWLGLNRVLGSPVTPSIPAGVALNTSTGARLTTAGIWANNSDRSLKSEFEPVPSRDVLRTLTGLPVSSWEYDAEPGVRHIGPVAQDFQRAFGFGSDNRHIGTIDADGVALAAIKGLNRKLEATLRRKRARISSLAQRLGRLERIVARR